MTKNQIEYLKLLETQRSNKAQESLTASRDATARELGFANLAENNRHNVETERQARAVLDETSRHNVVTEQETARHNRVQEELGYANLSETNRHNVMTEQLGMSNLLETTRHNMSIEGIQSRQADISAYNAETQRFSALESQRHNVSTETETARHNMAYEVETNRHNVATESETARHNRQQESIGWGQISLGYAELASLDAYRDKQIGVSLLNLGESQRHNLQVEGETQRSNMARELETQRHNEQQESIQSKYNTGQLAIQRNQISLRKQELAETVRHNQYTEYLTQKNNTWSNINNSLGVASKYAPYIMGMVGG